MELLGIYFGQKGATKKASGPPGISWWDKQPMKCGVQLLRENCDIYQSIHLTCTQGPRKWMQIHAEYRVCNKTHTHTRPWHWQMHKAVRTEVATGCEGELHNGSFRFSPLLGSREENSCSSKWPKMRLREGSKEVRDFTITNTGSNYFELNSSQMYSEIWVLFKLAFILLKKKKLNLCILWIKWEEYVYNFQNPDLFSLWPNCWLRR